MRLILRHVRASCGQSRLFRYESRFLWCSPIYFEKRPRGLVHPEVRAEGVGFQVVVFPAKGRSGPIDILCSLTEADSRSETGRFLVHRRACWCASPDAVPPRENVQSSSEEWVGSKIGTEQKPSSISVGTATFSSLCTC